jgi:hypothetical protein
MLPTGVEMLTGGEGVGVGVEETVGAGLGVEVTVGAGLGVDCGRFVAAITTTISSTIARIPNNVALLFMTKTKKLLMYNVSVFFLCNIAFFCQFSLIVITFWKFLGTHLIS